MLQIARLAVSVVGATTVIVIVGWYTGMMVLTKLPGFASMKPTTAVILLLLAVGLLLIDKQRVAVTIGTVVALLGTLTLVEVLMGRSIGIDTILMGIRPGTGSLLMAPATALVGLLLGCSLATSGLARTWLSPAFALLALCGGQIAFLGYLYGASSLYAFGSFAAMAPQTFVCTIVLGSVLLLHRYESSPAGLLADRGSAGTLLRWAIPFFIIGPLVLGLVRLWGQQANLYDTKFGVVLLVITMTVLGCTVSWVAAARLRDLDRLRDHATVELAQSIAGLESAVTERTAELADTALQLNALVRLAPVGIVELDPTGALLTANDQWLALSGLRLDQSLGSGWAAAIHPDDLERVTSEWAAHAAAGTAYQTSVRFRTPKGRINWVQVHTSPTDSDGVVVGHVAAVTDVTALRVAEHEASAARARFEAAFESSPLGTAIVTLDGYVVEGNRRLFELAGPAGKVLNRPIENIFQPTISADESHPVTPPARRQSHQSSERQLRGSHAQEITVNVSVAEIHEDARVTGLLYQLEDITARLVAEARVEHQAFHDSLTDLPNRLLLLGRLDDALHAATQSGRGVGVLFLDLDGFKAVNDTLGHQAGDAVLVEVAARLVGGARANDTVARIGGDEFVVLCPDIASTAEVAVIAERLQQSLVQPIRVGTATASIDASIGIAFGSGSSDPESLLSDADQAMYLVKNQGHGAVEVGGERVRAVTSNRLETETALREAVGRGEIETWYQPIVDLQNGGAATVVATEALARWRRPATGIMMPGDFIALAEESGLIADIGQAVLNQACLAATGLDRVTVSVNVSARQFTRDDFSDVVRQALRVSGLPPEQLCLELTESSLLDAIGTAAATFAELRQLGVRLAIDDFGTGYSSFTHLRAFTFDLLKIDMTFIQGIEESGRDRGVVEGILRLADVLHLDVIAEGIETAGQRDLLREMGCRYGQGYYFSRPSPAAQPTLVAHP
ncbi:putative bifunctional diguanylate cyclase/phosphodiesterase [Cryobacterium luteum]|uniref:Phosphodiesterase n=1 Tax=Cryobacterium luteum TaxID=1424661 RepID=A0A1H8BZJ2_9MICO|nr:GGDEF domain-containing phosphodiesterase [Cryobacterium luteum]TFB89190.1 phosphodiesterase [Cryobacterium luteum]SEM88216.1 PAS domain S-box-containing protein/diguanylate cyclase (GGDEF) domain-containing protein [Cryobacterium luteum]